MRGRYLRKYSTIALIFFVLSIATFAHSQEQVDVAVGGSILYSPRVTSISEANPPLSERGGIYPNVSVNARLKEHLGLNVEASWRETKANYYGFEKYRPILVDVNGLYQTRITRKFGLDLMAGIGVDRTVFNLPGGCFATAGSCYTSGTHFMEHLGAGVRYYVFRRFFVRPEANYYHVESNQGFNSGSLLRVGALVGYTWGSR